MKNVREAKRRALFKCDVTGLAGMYVGTVDAVSDNPNKNPVQVVYIPLKDINEGMIERWKGVQSYKSLWEVTNTKYPENALIGPKPVRDSNAEEGLFSLQVIATQDIHGQNSHRKYFVDETLEHRVDNLEEKLDEAQKETGLKDVDNIEQDGDKRQNDDDYKRSKNHRDNFGGLEDEFQRRH